MLRESLAELKRLQELVRMQDGGGGAINLKMGKGKTHAMGTVQRDMGAIDTAGLSAEEVEQLKQQREEEYRRKVKESERDLKSVMAASEMSKEQQAKTMKEFRAAQKRNEEQQDELAKKKKKLREYQQKVIDHTTVMEKAEVAAAKLRQKQVELKIAQERERRDAARKAEIEREKGDLKEEFEDLNEENKVKTQRIQKQFTRYKEATRQLADLKEQNAEERSRMLEAMRELAKEVGLVTHVLENCMPPEKMSWLEREAENGWDEDAQEYRLQHLEVAGNAVRPSRRPASATSYNRPEDGPLTMDPPGVPANAIPALMQNPYLRYDSSQTNGYRHSSTRIYARGQPAPQDATMAGKKERSGGQSGGGKSHRKKRPSTAGRKRSSAPKESAAGWAPPTH